MNTNRTFAAVCAALLVPAGEMTAVPIPVSGTISSNTVWSGLIHIVNNVIVASGVTLTVSPGTVVKAAVSRNLEVRGILDVQGDAATPVVFTSILDDSAGGDTNGDGNATAPAAGNWGGILLNSTNPVPTRLRHGELRFAGSISSAVRVTGGSLEVDHFTVRDSPRTGVELANTTAGANHTLNHLTIQRTGAPGLFVSSTTSEVVSDSLIIEDVSGTHVRALNAGRWRSSGSTLRGSGLPVIELRGGTITDSRRWNDNPVYYLFANTTIAPTGRLDVASGTIVKFNLAVTLTVNGFLNAQGTADRKVIFTSIRDDSVGGDSGGDGANTQPVAGDWSQILVNGAQAVGNLQQVEVRYAGRAVDSLRVVDGTLTVSQSLIATGQRSGVSASGRAEVTMLNNRFEDFARFGLELANTTGGFTTLDGNAIARAALGAYTFSPLMNLSAARTMATQSGQANAIQALGTTLNRNHTWRESLVYLVPSTLTIAAGSTLTLAPGTIIKKSPATSLIVRGTLNAEGTASQPVIVTSLRDDTAGGDSNGDGNATMPAPGDWLELEIGGTSGPLVASANLNHLEVRYAGSAINNAVEIEAVASLVFRNGRVRDCLRSGLSINQLTAPLDFGGTVVENTVLHGIVLSGIGEFKIDLSDVLIRNTGAEGLNMNARSDVNLTGVRLEQTARDGAVLVNSPSTAVITSARSWPARTYVVNGNVQIGPTGSLTLAPGVILKFQPLQGIQVDGALTALGTAGNPILFTSIKDDTGGDSNNDGNLGLPQPGDWFSLWVRDTQGGAPKPDRARVVAEHLHIRYAGREPPGNVATPALLIDGGVHAFTNLLIDQVTDAGYRSRVSTNSRTTLRDVTIRNTGAEAISLGLLGTATLTGGGGHVDLDDILIENIAGDAVRIGARDITYTLQNLTMRNVAGVNGTRVTGQSVSSALTLGFTPLVVIDQLTRVLRNGSLRILPGTVVKVAITSGGFGADLTAQDGPIMMEGTPDRPIIVTSLADDVLEDTNRDGAASQPTPGDWRGIILQATSSLRNVEVRYAGFRTGGGAAVEVDLADFELHGVTIRNSSGGGLLIGRGSGTVANCLIYDIRDAGVRFAPISVSQPFQVELINNTIFGGTHGVWFTHSASPPNIPEARLVNNILAGATNAGVQTGGFLRLSLLHNVLFNPAAALGNLNESFPGAITYVEQTGNLMTDPLFVNPAGGIFELGPQSPAIDAAFGTEAPETDRRGFERFDDASVVDTGTGRPTFADIGALERLGASDPTLNPDLVVVPGSVVFRRPTALRAAGPLPPDTFFPDDPIIIEWTVENQGGSDATRPRKDGVFLSEDGKWDIKDKLLFKVETTRFIPAGGGRVQGSITSKMKPFLPSSFRVIIRADLEDDQFEFRNDNNDGVSTNGLSMDLRPLLVPGSLIASLSPTSPESVFKFELLQPVARDLRITAFPPPEPGSVELLVRRGDLPTSLRNDRRAVSSGRSLAEIQLPLSTPGLYFVSIRSGTPLPASANVRVDTELLSLGARRVEPDRVGNAGNASLRLTGAQFLAGTRVDLFGPGQTQYVGNPVIVSDSSRLTATFPLRGATPGLYSIRLSTLNATTVVNQAVQVLGATTGVVTRSSALIVVTTPSAIRRGPPVPVPVNVTLINPTANDLPALIKFEGTLDEGVPGGKFSFTPGGPKRDNLLILGGADDGPPGALRPGETTTMTLYYHGTGEPTPNPNPPTSMVCGDAFPAPTDDTPIDYDLDPNFYLHREAMARIGSTWGEAYNSMRTEATRLRDLGFVERDGNCLLQNVFESVSGQGNNSVSGTLVDDQGALVRNTRVAVADTRVEGGFHYITTTDSNGTFRADGLVSGQYSFVAEGFGSNSNAVQVAVHGGMTTNGGTVAVRRRVTVPETPATAQETAPVFLKIEGVPHLFYERNGLLTHSYFRNSNWMPGVVVAEGTEPNPVYSPTLLDGQPALALFFQQAGATPPADTNNPTEPDANDIQLLVAIARPDAAGHWTWHKPVVIVRHEQAASFHPTVILDSNGVPLATWQMQDRNNNDADTDLYFRLRPLTATDTNSSMAQVSSMVTVPLAPGADGVGGVPWESPAWAAAEQGTLCDFVPVSYSATYVFKPLGDGIDIPGVGRNTFEVNAGATVVANLAGAKVGGLVRLKFGFFKDKDTDAGLSVEGTGSLIGEWKLDRQSCEYEFQKLVLSGGVLVRVRVPIPQLSFSLGPIAKVAVGLQMDGSVKGQFEWTTFQTLVPDDFNLEGSFGLGPYAYGRLLGGLGSVKLSGIGTMKLFGDGNGNLKVDFVLTLDASATIGSWEYKYSATFFEDRMSESALRAAALPPGARLYQDGSGWRLTESFNLREKPGTASDYSSAGTIIPLVSNLAAERDDESSTRMATGSDGMIHAFWTREQATLGNTLDNRILTARFDGTNWTDPEPIPGADGGNRELAARLDRNGELLLVFVHADLTGFDLGSNARAARDAFENSDLFFTRRTATGWTPPAPVAPIPGNACHVALSSDDDNRVFASWVESDGSNDVLHAAEWDALNKLWRPAQEISRGTITASASILEITNVVTAFWAQGVSVAAGDAGSRTVRRLFSAKLQDGMWSARQELNIPAPTLPASPPPAPAPALASPAPGLAAAALPPGGILDLLDINRYFLVPLGCCNDEEALAAAELPDVPSIQELQETFPGLAARSWSEVVGAFDPNDKLGLAGSGPRRFVRKSSPLPYTVTFENDPMAGATAPALSVRITDQLDPDFDFSSFAFRGFGFGNLQRTVPPGLQRFSDVVDWRNQDGSPLQVQVDATFDPQTGMIDVQFTSIDPATGRSPGGAFDGFLLVEDGSERGEGFIEYVVQAKTELATGTELRNQADIVFDDNEPIRTPELLHTIDDDPPSSNVLPLPPSSRASFAVTWTGTDGNGSGIAAFEIYVSDDGGPFILWRRSTDTSAVFIGQPNHTYGFYSVAVDGVGLAEPRPLLLDAMTVVGPDGPVIQSIHFAGPSTVRIAFTTGEAPTGPLRLESTPRLIPGGTIWTPDPAATITPLGGNRFEATSSLAGDAQRYFRVVLE